MSDINIAIRDAIRSFESIEILNKETERTLNSELICRDSVRYMNAMLTAIHAVTHCQVQSLKTILGDE